jgi:hypothetical protein
MLACGHFLLTWGRESTLSTAAKGSQGSARTKVACQDMHKSHHAHVHDNICDISNKLGHNRI